MTAAQLAQVADIVCRCGAYAPAARWEDDAEAHDGKAVTLPAAGHQIPTILAHLAAAGYEAGAIVDAWGGHRLYVSPVFAADDPRYVRTVDMSVGPERLQLIRDIVFAAGVRVHADGFRADASYRVFAHVYGVTDSANAKRLVDALARAGFTAEVKLIRDDRAARFLRVGVNPAPIV